MKLLVDIGNTKVSMVLADRERIIARFFIRTDRRIISRASLKKLFKKNLSKIDEIIIVSVVPDFQRIFIRTIKNVLKGVNVNIVGKDIKVPIKNKYKTPSQVGKDRLVVCYGALSKIKPPFIVIDFGTAVTFDYVNERKEYEGGLIFPGLRLALASLTEEAALLPHIVLKDIRGFVGKDTRNSMNNGIIYGYASLCDGVIERFKKVYGKNIKIAITGGDASLVTRHSKYMDKIYPDLIFDGLLSLVVN